MRPIRRLSPETASRIAAGEVIERPLSALKEVLENALDAGARAIEIRVSGSLDREFVVSDDGQGLAADDLELALERHATSKIASLEDLDRLDSLGFRGEALPSIAAVSHLRLSSRPAGTESASWIDTQGGAVISRGAEGRAPGTTVMVSDLFYNTPARRKFLGTAAGELRAALRMLEAYALARPDVAMRLVVDGRERFDWPPATSARDRLSAIRGGGHAAQWLEAQGERDGIRLTALIGLPEHARGNREGQVLLINRRWVQSPLVAQALRQAYGNLLPAGRHPAAVLWIEVPPARLDVNVHPTKREVRFATEDSIFSLVAAACAKPLATLAPPFTVVKGGAPEPAWVDRVREKPVDQNQTWLSLGMPEAAEGAAAPAATPAGVPPAAEPEMWQLHRTYILSPLRDGLLIVDQHAAHERILYEEARRRMVGERGASQQLLFPALVDLSNDQFELLLELGPWLVQLGWDLSPLGPPTVVIQGVPSNLRREQPARVLQDVLDGMSEHTGQGGEEDVSERLARSWACHAAVRAGDPLSSAEMRALVDELFATSRPHGDPHGRPTFVRMDLDELHKRFSRG